MIDILRFRLRNGADASSFVAADKEFQEEFVYRQPGLRRRTTARSGTGDWVVVTLWDSDDAADAAAAHQVTEPVFREFLASIDPSSMRSARYAELD